eukprot:COSAG02_NODE_13013_length_1460_cov_1.163115_2_plen_64_part_01
MRDLRAGVDLLTVQRACGLSCLACDVLTKNNQAAGLRRHVRKRVYAVRLLPRAVRLLAPLRLCI